MPVCERTSEKAERRRDADGSSRGARGNRPLGEELLKNVQSVRAVVNKHKPNFRIEQYAK